MDDRRLMRIDINKETLNVHVGGRSAEARAEACREEFREASWMGIPIKQLNIPIREIKY